MDGRGDLRDSSLSPLEASMAAERSARRPSRNGAGSSNGSTQKLPPVSGDGRGSGRGAAHANGDARGVDDPSPERHGSFAALLEAAEARERAAQARDLSA